MYYLKFFTISPLYIRLYRRIVKRNQNLNYFRQLILHATISLSIKIYSQFILNVKVFKSNI